MVEKLLNKITMVAQVHRFLKMAISGKQYMIRSVEMNYISYD